MPQVIEKNPKIPETQLAFNQAVITTTASEHKTKQRAKICPLFIISIFSVAFSPNGHQTIILFTQSQQTSIK